MSIPAVTGEVMNLTPESKTEVIANLKCAVCNRKFVDVVPRSSIVDGIISHDANCMFCRCRQRFTNEPRKIAKEE